MIFKGWDSSLRFLGFQKSTWKIAEAQPWQQELWKKVNALNYFKNELTCCIKLGEAYGDIEAKGHSCFRCKHSKIRESRQ